MHQYTKDGSDAITAPERRFRHRFYVDWDNDGRFAHPLSALSSYVTETTRDQTLTATAPDEVKLVEGYAAAKLDVIITGEFQGISLASHFAPNNGRSIFYTQGITLGVQCGYSIDVETRRGWETYVQFTGIVRDVHANRETGEVRIECLDNVELMRTKTRIPAYGMLTRYLVNGFKRALLVDSSSVIDLAARSAGFSAGPRGYDRYKNVDPARQLVLSVPFHGSILPEIGSLDNVEEFHLTEEWERDPALKARAEQYTVGPHDYLALNAVPRGKNAWAIKKFWAETAALYPSDRRLWGATTIAIWLYWPGNNVDESATIVEMFDTNTSIQLIVEGSNGGVCARTKGTTTGVLSDGYWLFMREPGWHFLEVAFDLYPGRDVKMRTRVDDKVSPIVARPYQPTNESADHPWQNLVTVTNKYALSDLQIMRSYYADDIPNITYDRTLYANANMSWGRNRITYTLRDSGREAWSLAKEVASAEYGVVYFDEYGRFIFANYDDVRSKQSTVVRTFTVDDLESLGLRTTMDSVRNVWRATTRTGRAGEGIVYDLARDDVLLWLREETGEYFPSVMVIDPGSWEGWFANKPEMMSVSPNPPPLLAEFADFTEHAPYEGYKSYQGDKYVGFRVDIVPRNTSRDMTKVVMWNPNSVPTGFVGPNQIERLRIKGTIVSLDEPRSWEVRADDSIREYGERVLEIADNTWLQDEFQTRNMLQSIVGRIARPIPVSDTVTVPGDPRIQLGDTIEVHDADGFGESMWLQVLGIKRTMDSDGLTDTYTVEMVVNPGQGVWDSPTYGLWDQSFIWR